MGLFGSTSPSFPILASLDYARDWCENYGKNEFGLTEQRTEALRNIIEKTGFFTVKGDLYDKTRITISVLNKNIDGFYLADELEKEKIIPEMADKNNVVLLFSPFNDLNDYESVKSFFENHYFQSSDKKINCPEIPHTTFKVKIKSAFFGKKETIPIKEAVGRIAAEAVVPYPPGVPVIIPGELITEELTEYLNIYHNVDVLNVIL
jgi:arginine/lysine/ornithine decarboxylase